jgi:predicted dehydrogenase
MDTRIFLAGAGVIAQEHAAAVSRLPESEGIPIYFSDPNPAAVETFLARFPQARAIPSSRELFEIPAQVGDIAIIATPPALHHTITLQALASGRHTLCEKPMALNDGQVQEMLAAAKKGGKLLGCCSCRFLGIGATSAAQEIIRKGELGPLYHATFIHRERRGRPGIEYQPATRWFLDKSKNGGGTLMNMGPYDFTTLNYILRPTRVDVLEAWQTNPITALDLPASIVFDVEQHIGASLRFHLADGSVMVLTYERSSCTHGSERAICEIEGLNGAIHWNWSDASGAASLFISSDDAGKVQDEERKVGSPVELGLHERPLVYFHRSIHGEDAPIAINEQAVFNFSIPLAIYRCAETGQPQTIGL